jgi:hypothetical protein
MRSRGWARPAPVGSRLAGLAVAVVAAVSGVGLAGCSARGATLGTTSTPCFHALPPATAAVGHRGRLVGVRLIPVDRLRKRAPQSAPLGKKDLCVVAFEGHFTAGEVKHLLSTSIGAGKYAVVAVTPDGHQVLGSLLLHRLPLAFRHSV